MVPQVLEDELENAGELYGLLPPEARFGDALCPERFIPSPGGAVNPGGGPLAVVNPFVEPGCMPLRLPIEPAALWPDDGPERTPRGFLEKLRRMPPLTLLCNGCP